MITDYLPEPAALAKVQDVYDFYMSAFYDAYIITITNLDTNASTILSRGELLHDMEFVIFESWDYFNIYRRVGDFTFKYKVYVSGSVIVEEEENGANLNTFNQCLINLTTRVFSDISALSDTYNFQLENV
jgi:hypothetical protein